MVEWEHGSSVRVLAEQVQGLEFNPQYHNNQKKNQNLMVNTRSMQISTSPFPLGMFSSNYPILMRKPKG
jgi:hypothetical protein